MLHCVFFLCEVFGLFFIYLFFYQCVLNCVCECVLNKELLASVTLNINGRTCGYSGRSINTHFFFLLLFFLGGNSPLIESSVCLSLHFILHPFLLSRRPKLISTLHFHVYYRVPPSSALSFSLFPFSLLLHTSLLQFISVFICRK